MRSLAVVSAALTLVVGWTTSAQQFAFDDPPPQPRAGPPTGTRRGSSFSETIVSTLSQSSQHTTLLHLLQRSKCIPLLAHIGNATLFAPTNAAWDDWASRHIDPDGSTAQGWLSSTGLGEWHEAEEEILATRIAQTGDEDGERRKLDNQNWALRQHLLYHMLNYTLPPEAFRSGKITTETTLLFPLAEEPEIPPAPPPGPPWLARGGEGMLGGHGQRLRFSGGKDGDRGKVGTDWKGQGGVEIWDGKDWEIGNGTDDGAKGATTGARWVRNGLVVGIEGVLEPPPSIDEIIRSTPSLSYLSHLLAASSPIPSPLPDDLHTTPHLTLFAPNDEAFQGVFDDIETRYLEGSYGGEGVGRIFGGGVLVGIGYQKGRVGWRDFWGNKGYEVEAVSGQGLVVEAPADGGLMVNGTEASAIDIFASNGVIHILPTLLLPENFTLLNSAEKVLLSVNATRFVSLLRSANISDTYIGPAGKGKEKEEEEAWTILAPTDEVLDMMDRWGGHGASIPQVWEEVGKAIARGEEPSRPDEMMLLEAPGDKDASPLAALLQYHILPGRLMPSHVKDGLLVGTELRTSALKGGRQRLRIEVSDRLDRQNWENIQGGEIRFGGSTVLGKPVKSGKSIIYLISSLLSPPDNVLQTAVSDLQLSTFIAAVYAAELDKAVKKTSGVTYFIPRNRAFNSLGLAMKYLLSAEGKDELRKVVKYHAVDGVVYSSDIETSKTVHKTIEGGEVILNLGKGKDGNITLSSPTKWEGYDSGESLPANGELRPARIVHTDALTHTGVIHTIDSLVLPADVRLTIAKLIRGSKHSTMMDLMIRAGLGWVLEGREPSGQEVEIAGPLGIVRSWSGDEGEGGQGDPVPDLDSLAMPSYTVLVPTDKAFSRLNLTRYLSDRDALLDLLKLHIIPTQPSTPRTAISKVPADPPRDGQPLSVGNDLVYSTLLSNRSKYGDVAFRATGDNSYIVGIKNARGGLGNDAARIGASGRASVRWRKGLTSGTMGFSNGKENKVEDEGDNSPSSELWRGGMTLGGGVFIIDSVLVPYQPSWFSRWGWLVITLVGIGVTLIIAGVSFAWWWYTAGRSKEGYEPLEGEEEE